MQNQSDIELNNVVAPPSQTDTVNVTNLVTGLLSWNQKTWETHLGSIPDAQWKFFVKDNLMLAQLFLGVMPEQYGTLAVALGNKLDPYFPTSSEFMTFLRCFSNRGAWTMVIAAFGQTAVLNKLFPDKNSVEQCIEKDLKSSPDDKSRFLNALRSAKTNPITLFAWEIDSQIPYLAFHETYGHLEVTSSQSDMSKLVADCLAGIPAPNPSKFWSMDPWRVPINEMITEMRKSPEALDVDAMQVKLKVLLLAIPASETKAADHIFFCLFETEKCKPKITISPEFEKLSISPHKE